MNVKNFEYVKKIEEKKFKDFDSFFESDEFNKIEDLEIKRKVFYYFALKFSTKENKNITELYQDLKWILEKMQSKDYLKKYDKEIYINIMNNYLEKVEIFNARKNFYCIEQHLYKIRDLIKLFNNHYQKKECPKEIFESLQDLYEIILIKKKHKVPHEHQKKIERHLNEFKRLLDYLSNKNGYNVEIKDERKQINEEKNIKNNIINQNKFDDKNFNVNNFLINNKNMKDDNQNINENNNLNIDRNLQKEDIENIFDNFDLSKPNNNKNTLNNIDINDIENNKNIYNNNDNNKNLNKQNDLLIFENANNYVPEGFGFVDDVINKEKRKENNKNEEKGYTNELYNKVNVNNNQKKVENPYKNNNKEEEEKKEENLSQRSINKNKKKLKKKKIKEEKEAKYNEFMSLAEGKSIDDF